MTTRQHVGAAMLVALLVVLVGTVIRMMWAVSPVGTVLFWLTFVWVSVAVVLILPPGFDRDPEDHNQE